VIATRTEIKTLLQISVTTYDTLIDALISICQDEIIEYCNSHFAQNILDTDNEQFEGGNTYTFASSGKTITDSDSLFPFSTGQDIYISGSRYNDGHYTLTNATTSVLTTSETLIDEAEGANVVIKLVTWPKALKMTLADLIGYKISDKCIGTTSENISGAISTGYAPELGSYPETLMKGLNKYRVVGFR